MYMQQLYQKQVTLTQSMQVKSNQESSQVVTVEAVSPVDCLSESTGRSGSVNFETMEPCSENMQTFGSIPQMQLSDSDVDVQTNEIVLPLHLCTDDSNFVSAMMKRQVTNKRHNWTTSTTKIFSNRAVPYCPNPPQRYLASKKSRCSNSLQQDSVNSQSPLPTSLQKEVLANSNSVSSCDCCPTDSQEQSPSQNFSVLDILNDCRSPPSERCFTKWDSYSNSQRTLESKDADPWPSNFFSLSSEHLMPEPVLSLALKSSMILKPFQVKHGYSCESFTFHMPRYVLQDLLNRNDLDLELKCFHNRDANCSTNWPQSVSVALNSVPLPIPRDRDRLHLSQMPIFLKKYSRPYLNCLQISVSSCSCSHQFVVQLVQRVKILLKNHLISVKQCLDKIITAMVSQNFFKLCLSAPSNVFLLVCPLGGKRIKIPARGRICKHVQCFDLESFLAVCAKMDSWKCPVCGKALSISDLEIDQYIWQILNQVSNISLQAIAFDNDAKWTPLKEIDEGQSVNKIKPGQRIIVFSEADQQHSASSKLPSQPSTMRNKFGQENSVGDPSSSEVPRIGIASTLEQSLMSQSQLTRQTLNMSTSSSNDNGIKYGDPSVSSSNGNSLLCKAFCSSQFGSFMNHNDRVHIASVGNKIFPCMPQNAPASYQFSLIEELSPQPCSHPDELLTLQYSDGLPTPQSDGYSTPQYSVGLPTTRSSTPVEEQGQMNGRTTQHVYYSITGESADSEQENHRSNLDTTVINSDADGGRPALDTMEPIIYCNDESSSLEIPTVTLSELTGTYCDASYTQIGLNAANFASYLEPSEKSSHDDMNKAPTTTLSDFVDELLSCML